MTPLLPMTVADDFAAYEAFVSRNMLPDDYYTGDELRQHIETGYISAWWIKDGAGVPVAWCAVENENPDWEGACNFLGLVVCPSFKGRGLPLRMIRHVARHVGGRPLTAYIQPGVGTEKLMKPFGFAYVEFKTPWNFYVRSGAPCLPASKMTY